MAKIPKELRERINRYSREGYGVVTCKGEDNLCPGYYDWQIEDVLWWLDAIDSEQASSPQKRRRKLAVRNAAANATYCNTDKTPPP